ncbi:Putative type-1 restriction enzyme specificity protein [Frankliniella fusca]|uniref:Type-1 restriction enzyme specificity protein n=1 Tax=Frankliniella fusca TaxID=407009 RepID=A0AAE1HPK4_9NEOP|nr:Putative type-1 restriction enzyme specificity protein [Frankliniella fusca]
MDPEDVTIEDSLPSMPRWPHNFNKRPELETRAVASLPPSVLLREIAGSLFPVYILNVRVVGIEPAITGRKRYLNLYFHLELHVEDNLGQMIKIVVERDAAVRFFGCTVYRFLLNPRRRLRIKKLLETLLRSSSSPRSAAVPGVTFDIRIIPIAVDQCEEVKFHMFGDNTPLCDLAKKIPVPRP